MPLRFTRVADQQAREATDNSTAPQITAEIPVHEVETSIKRGAAWAVGSQIASQAIRIVGIVVLARLLSKQDYGSAGLAVIVASYSVMLGDLGYGTALVQRPKISQRSASTAFWAAIAAGGICFVVTAVAAYPAARILGTPEITWLVIAGGSTLFLVALGSASNALLTRGMRFGVIQAIGVIALVTATACSTTSAVLAAGPWALVTQQVVLAGDDFDPVHFRSEVATVSPVLVGPNFGRCRGSRCLSPPAASYSPPIVGNGAFGWKVGGDRRARHMDILHGHCYRTADADCSASRTSDLRWFRQDARPYRPGRGNLAKRCDFACRCDIAGAFWANWSRT